MSTPETLGGITLDQYASVLACEGEGIALEAALAEHGLDAIAWTEGAAAWNRRVAAAAVSDDPLLEALDERLQAARARLVRRIPPLDEDLGAWLDFLRSWSSNEAPEHFLAKLKLTTGDVTRLQTLWASRLAGDTALRDRAAALGGGEPGPMPAIAPEPFAIGRAVVPLPPLEPATSEVTELIIDDRPPPLFDLPFSASTSSATAAAPTPPPRSLDDAPPPPASVTSPLSPPPPPSSIGSSWAVVEETAIGVVSPFYKAPLPFTAQKGSDGAGDTETKLTPVRTPPPLQSPPSLEAEPPPPSTSFAQAPPAPSSSPEAALAVDFPIERYAALCADLAHYPERSEAIFARYGLAHPRTRAAVDGFWHQRLTSDPEEHERFAGLYWERKNGLP